MFLVCPTLKETSSCAFPVLRCLLFLGSVEYHWRWLYVQFLAEVVQVLRPSFLVEDAEDAAGLSAVPQSPRPQGGEQ